MRAVRFFPVVVVALLATLAVPAAAHPTSDFVRISPWSAAVETRGLDETATQAVTDLWEEFVTGAPAHAACLLASPPRIEAKPDMPPRAAYAPATATLFVKPGDLDRLVVFHELAHHLDFTCGAADEIGADLRAAQGIPAAKPWWKDGSPVTWPAEYFANAVAINLGEHSRHGVTSAAVEVVEEWMGRGEPNPEPTEEPTVLGVLLFDDPGPDVPRVS